MIRNVKSSAVTVGTTAVPLPATALANRRVIEVYNNGSVDIYIGGSDVTTSNGIPVSAGEFYSTQVDRALLYAVSGTANQNLRIIEKS